MRSLFLMGNYSWYVWSAYSLAFVILVGQWLRVKSQRKRVRQTLSHWFKS